MFLETWGEAALTSVSYFWMAFWAFGLGYAVSAAIQVFASRSAMSRLMGGTGLKPMTMATIFGFLSSSCSFAALAATRSFVGKGASIVASLAFLLASTNLVIELGIVIAVFLSWQFVVGEYLGGLLLIMITWGLVRALKPDALFRTVRDRLDEGTSDDVAPLSALWRDKAVWGKLAQAYVAEWTMVWKDVTVGFTIAGIITAFVPAAFFVFLFPGTGGEPTFLQVLAQAVIGPVAAFFTFIGSMGNIPLAGVLYQNGVSMAGIMAFIFSDLVVLPVLRVNAQFYGWNMALFIAGLFLVAIVVSAVVLYYGFMWTGFAPQGGGSGARVAPQDRFALDTRFWLNAGFAILTAGAFWVTSKVNSASKHPGGDHAHQKHGEQHNHNHGGNVITTLAYVSLTWLAVGALFFFTI